MRMVQITGQLLLSKMFKPIYKKNFLEDINNLIDFKNIIIY